MEIAIVGSGCRFAGEADSPSKLWELLCDPKPVSRPVPFLQGYHHENAKHHGHTNVQSAYLLGDEQGNQKFDAPFFSISHAEASAMDPQLRQTLEVIYEALEDSGISMQQLRGSDTAVYAGNMVGDYEMVMNRDHDVMPQYQVTGTTRTMLSSRVSYFYDWHGPSMTIDTACSSSLTALHHAVQQLRSGHSTVAVVAAANLLMDPIPFISMSNFTMLSPQGTCRMWDAEANGYGRGEGVAAIVLKTRAAAEADGDVIDCIIRETALNQDGRSMGPTTPSASAQAQLIRDCYARAGLDLLKASDRPQFFEAHGTGTPAGDPIEAEAISTALFPHDNKDGHHQLLVGSIKTVVGHTEATAGIAALLKASLMLKHGAVPSNMQFNTLNPKLARFYNNKLQIPTRLTPWPKLIDGATRRVSVNSFGLGGSNAHAILEAYTSSPSPVSSSSTNTPVFSPLVFSASTEESLRSYLTSFLAYVRANSSTLSLRDICHTLHSRRSSLPVATSIVARSIQHLCDELDALLQTAETSSDSASNLGIRVPRPTQPGKPRVLGVFTGQGAQWPQMGLDLIQSSPAALNMLETLQHALQNLPEASRPSWSLLEELQKNASSSRVMDAAFSQPLCTALQIIQVDLLRTAGVDFVAAVGHSSGEIGAAYASGFISAQDAICIAYYRGLATSLPDANNDKKGSMIAVGTSQEDAQHLLSFPEFHRRACVAAVNSSSSVTISGDDDAMEELMVIFQDELKFVRKLKVDKAYHSHHMRNLSRHYLQALQDLSINIGPQNGTSWFSSVKPNSTAVGGSLASLLGGQYWVDNMVEPVLFKQALGSALSTTGVVDLIIELGPHPALKGPASEVIQEELALSIPYTGLLNRGQPAIDSFAKGLGYAWSHLEEGALKISRFDAFVSGNQPVTLVKGLPGYSWDHQDGYWHESRQASAIRKRSVPAHTLLGHLLPSSTKANMQWRQNLSVSELPWLRDHRLQDIAVFPATGYIVTVLEASLALAESRSVATVSMLDIEFSAATVFDREDSSVEVLLSLSNITITDEEINAFFYYHAGSGQGSDASLELKASGRVCVALVDSANACFPPREPRQTNLVGVRAERFYESLSQLEYTYTGQFQSLNRLERKLGVSRAHIAKLEKSPLLLHPGVLDACYQSAFLAYCHPNDGSFRSMYMPRRIKKLVASIPALQAEISGHTDFEVDSMQTQPFPHDNMMCDLGLYHEGGSHALIQTQGLELVPMSKPTEKDDVQVFSTITWNKTEPTVARSPGHSKEEYLSEVASVLVHKNAHMRVLEICHADSTSPAMTVFAQPGLRISSYTKAAPTSDYQLDEETINKMGAKSEISSRLYDDSKTLHEQGFEEGSFDLVILSSPVSVDALVKMRYAVRAGGYLVAMDLDTSLPNTAADINSQLRLARFTELPVEVFKSCSSTLLTQAVDDELSFLQAPRDASLVSAKLAYEARIASLVILHGDSTVQAHLAEKLASALFPFCDSITILPALARVLETDISPQSTVFMSIIDTQAESIFSALDQQGWSAMKHMIENSKAIFWATQGRCHQNPHANMILGLLRSSARDNPALNYMLFDMENPSQVTEENISSAFLRYHLLSGTDCEREVVLNSDGHLMIPRVTMSESINNRFNSNFRPVLSSIPSKQHNTALVSAEAGWRLELEALRPHAGLQDGFTQLQTKYSLALAIQVTASSRMFLAIGTLEATGQQMIALCPTNCSQLSAPARLTKPITTLSTVSSYPGLLKQVAKYIFASNILRGLLPGACLLVHEPDEALAVAIAQAAHALMIDVVFTTSDESLSLSASTKAVENSEWIYVHPLATAHALTKIVRRGFSVFVNMSARATDSVADGISAVLPASSKQYRSSNLSGREGWADLSSVMSLAELESCLVMAMAQASASVGNDNETVNLENITSPEFRHNPFQVIDWSQNTCDTVSIRPVETLVSFPGSKTYWMVGLAGGLGLSLCEWMADRGARSFAISSRNPKVDPLWLKAMKQRGVKVLVVSCDIANMGSVHDAYNQIQTAASPIGGVIQGAMVLRDTSIQNMSLATFQEVTKCKVEGTMHLDSLFQEDTLDLFICLSSVTSIIGNFGQANYAAANTFMTSLVEQRRRKGLAGSVMHIGPIFGVGYITSVTEDSIMSEKDLQRMGCCRTSEREFQQLFGEAVLASYARGENTHCEVISGLQSFGARDSKRPPWEGWQRMCHLVTPQREIREGSGVAASKKPLKEQLAEAESQKQIHEIVWEAFTSILASEFRIKISRVSKAELGEMRFDQLGIDSLAAVEIRGWFMTNLGVNIPTLKILNGASIDGLVSFAVGESLSQEASSSASDGLGEATSASASSFGDSFDVYTNADSTSDESDSSLNIVKSLPVSFTQSRFYPSTGVQAQDAVGLNHTIHGKFNGSIDPRKLANAIRVICKRHEILRTAFFDVDGKQMQHILADSRISLEQRQVAGADEVAELAAALQRGWVHQSNVGETLRFLLLTAASGETFFILALHPLVLDATSFIMFFNLLGHYYDNPNSGRRVKQLNEVSQLQHANYKSGKFERELSYWKNEFVTAPPPLPVMSLASVEERPLLSAYENIRSHCTISEHDRDQVAKTCLELRVTPFHFYLTVLRALLMHYTFGGEDVTIAVAESGRGEEAEHMEVLGPLYNLILLRLVCQKSDKFQDLLQTVRDKTYSGLANSKLPYPALVQELQLQDKAKDSPFFQVFIDYRVSQKYTMPFSDDVELQVMGFELNVPYDLYLDIIDLDGLHHFFLRKDMFDQQAADTLAVTYKRLVETFARDPNLVITKAGLD